MGYVTAATRKGTDIASAATITPAATYDRFDVTGTTTITTINTDSRGIGARFWLRFGGAVQLTHDGTKLKLTGAANFTSAAGDAILFEVIGTNQVQELVRRSALVAADLPTVPLSKGGTNADLSATGGATHFLRQASAGADVTVGAIVNTDLPTAARTRTLMFLIDGGGAEIADGIAGDLMVDVAGTIQAVTVLADQSGSIVVDIWKDTYANFPPTDTDSITASAPPTISTATKAQDSTLTGWTTSISAGDILRFNVDSCTDIQRATVLLKVLV